MQLFRSLTELPSNFSAGSVTIGNFDGVHRGHARIVECLTQRAAQFQGPSVVFTFEPHPVRLLRPDEAPVPLTWVDRKVALLAALKLDIVIAYPTDKALLELGPDDYFHRIVRTELRARAVVEGPNFYFGKDRAGDINRLTTLCADNKMNLDIVEPLKLGAEYISSSRVRAAISHGDVDMANRMLTQPYRIRGMITHGAGRGNTIGFPTANVSAVDTLLPGPGVYAGATEIAGTRWPAAINVGGNPTFGEDLHKVEVHVVGFSGSLYGQPLEVDFLGRLRDIQPFASVDELKRQLRRDVQASQAKFADSV